MRAYQHMVFSTAARLAGNDMQAEDIAQETFIKAYENFERLRGSPSAGGWLKTVATNLSLNYLSRYRKRWRFFSEQENAPEAAAPDSFVAELSADEEHARLEEALRRLPDHQRVPLVLFHFEDMPYEEIASKLGASIAKIKTDIHRGRAALVPVLKRSGIDAGTLKEDL
jgi:RNA polymerase sigma-70 factor, ECF subfamily